MSDCSKDPWLKLIGLDRDSVELGDALYSYEIDLSQAEVKLYDNDTILYNLYDLGLSFTFIKGLLDSIDFYQLDHKFKCVSPDLTLPFSISLEYTGERFAAEFGEPKDKGGGFSTWGVDVWFRYEHIQIDLDNRSWDSAQSSRWKAITLF